MGCMTGKSPKRPRDFNQLAKLIVDIATEDADAAGVKKGAVVRPETTPAPAQCRKDRA